LGCAHQPRGQAAPDTLNPHSVKNL
jgi:hypothetical protein